MCFEPRAAQDQHADERYLATHTHPRSFLHEDAVEHGGGVRWWGGLQAGRWGRDETRFFSHFSFCLAICCCVQSHMKDLLQWLGTLAVVPVLALVVALVDKRCSRSPRCVGRACAEGTPCLHFGCASKQSCENFIAIIYPNAQRASSGANLQGASFRAFWHQESRQRMLMRLILDAYQRTPRLLEAFMGSAPALSLQSPNELAPDHWSW